MADGTINFELWLNGKLELDSAISLSKNENDRPKIVSIEFFSLEERDLIRKDQELYFQNQVDELLNCWINKFNEQFKSSKAKGLFVQRHLSKLYSAILGNVQDLIDVDVVQLADGELVNRFFYVNALKYFDEHYVQGKVFDYSSIPNPISRQNLGASILPEVYAECLIEMYKILRANFFPIDTQKGIKTKKNDLEEEPKEDDEMEFEIPSIFSGKEAFKAFLLGINTLPIDEHRTSSLSLLYYHFHTHKYDYAIKYEVSKSEFCDFCNGFEIIKDLMNPPIEADQIRIVRTKAVWNKFNELKGKSNYFK